MLPFTSKASFDPCGPSVARSTKGRFLPRSVLASNSVGLQQASIDDPIPHAAAFDNKPKLLGSVEGELGVHRPSAKWPFGEDGALVISDWLAGVDPEIEIHLLVVAVMSAEQVDV
jgi:hypothetical protein